MPRLENWSISASPYQAPEVNKIRLQGEVYGHSTERHFDGKNVITSSIVSVEGKTVTTRSGSVYELGEINPDYLKWLEDTGLEYDEENPIKLKTTEEKE